MYQDLLSKVWRMEGNCWHFDTELLDDTIRKLAYEKWEREGRPEGRDEEFWLEAEAEINRMVFSE